MEIQGVIMAVLAKRGGTSAKGTQWEAQEFVLETAGQYPKKMVFEVFGSERLERFALQQGQEVLVSFDIEAREWNGRWFNSIRAYEVRHVGQGAAPVQPQMVQIPPVIKENFPYMVPVEEEKKGEESKEKDENLPF